VCRFPSLRPCADSELCKVWPVSRQRTFVLIAANDGSETVVTVPSLKLFAVAALHYLQRTAQTRLSSSTPDSAVRPGEAAVGANCSIFVASSICERKSSPWLHFISAQSQDGVENSGIRVLMLTCVPNDSASHVFQ
jgi:hypothetical protein